MVERTQGGGGLEEFDGIVESIEYQQNDFEGEERRQYHLTIDPKSVKVKGATQRIHEWVPLSKKSTLTKVQENSVMDRFLAEVESVVPEAKKCDSVEEALNCLKGKRIKFRRKKLGRTFEGKEAREYWVPVTRV
jgi:hypothetical protein